MKRGTILSLFICLLLTLAACGGSSGTAFTITFSPADGAASQTRTVTVTAVFSAAITEPSAAGWLTVFTLKKDNAGDTACTSVTYVSSTLTATCVHDTLDASSSYTSAITGLTTSSGGAITDASATFTTAGTANVSSMAKTSTTSTAGGDVTLTFTVDTAVTTAPTLTVTGGSATAGDCSLTDSTTVSCTVSGVDGCDSYTDYTVSLSGDDIIDYSNAFNSGDDEFDSGTTPNSCWTQSTGGGGSVAVSSGNLDFSAPSNGGEGNVTKTMPSVDFSMLTYISAVSRPTGTDSNNATIASVLDHDDGGSVGDCSYEAINMGSDRGFVVQGQIGVGTYNIGVPSESGDLSDARSGDAPIYACFVSYSNSVKTYISTDGSTFTEVSASNMDCIYPAGTCDITAVVDIDVSSATNVRLKGQSSAASGTLTGSMGYIRFKATGITGSASTDCPPLTEN